MIKVIVVKEETEVKEDAVADERQEDLGSPLLEDVVQDRIEKKVFPLIYPSELSDPVEMAAAEEMLNFVGTVADPELVTYLGYRKEVYVDWTTEDTDITTKPHEFKWMSLYYYSEMQF